MPDESSGLVSDTYTMLGDELDAIIDSTIIDYVRGHIGLVGLQKRLDSWQTSGGSAVVVEMNEQFDIYH